MPETDGAHRYQPEPDAKGEPRKNEPEMTELTVAGPDRVPPYFWYTVMFLIFCITVHNIVRLVLQHG